MDPTSPPESAIRFSFQAAASAAGSIDPRDGSELTELVRHLRELQAHLESSSRHEAAAVCGLGIQITERLVCRLHPTPEDLLQWVHLLLQSLGASLDLGSSRESPAPLPVARPSAARPLAASNLLGGGLRMAKQDGSRLGDLLVQMSFLKQAEVERALAVQRDTNCRLGEALVTLGLLTQKGLDAALRIQQRKRASGS